MAAAAVPPIAATTPSKRDNSHMSPPDKNIQTKVTVLSPKFKDLFIKTMRKEIQRQADGYDMEDELPLSQLRTKVTANRSQLNAQQKVNMNNSIVITDDLSQRPKENEDSVPGAQIEVVVMHDKVGAKPAPTHLDDRIDQTLDTAKAITELENEAVTDTGTEGDNAIIVDQADPADPVTTEPINEGNTAGADEVKDDKVDLQNEQLDDDPNTRRQNSKIDMLLVRMEEISKQLEKLDTMETGMREMNENILKKGDVEKMIKEQLIPVKTALTKHDTRLHRHQTELEDLKKKTENCVDDIKICAEKIKQKKEVNTAMEKQEIEEMVKKAWETKIDESNMPTSKGKNKNLIFHGMVEDKSVEDLTKVQDVAHDIGIMLHRWDVDKTSRIGVYEKGKKRPVKVELLSEITKLDFLKSKKKLKESQLYADIQVVPDETKEIRHAKAILRQAAYLAQRRGDRVWKRHDLIWVNGTKYTVETVEEIPDELRFKRRVTEVKKMDNTTEKAEASRDDGYEEMEITPPQEIASHNFNNKNWDQAARAAYKPPADVEQDGAAHLTKRGLAFFTGKSFLSNFYLVEFKFNGKVFYSAEQAYQYEKASICRDAVRMDRIYRAKTPKEAKDIGAEVNTTPLWERLKEDRMREIIDAKFTQNKEIRMRLMSTWGLYLIEGSRDGYWGAGKKLYSKDLIDGKWNGLNKLGEMLVDLRDDLRRRGF